MIKKLKNLSKLTKIYRAYKTGSVTCSYTPIRIWLEPTDKCNLACPLCINKTIPEDIKGYMEWPLFTRIIDQLSKEICDINLFHRGEPLLHPQIADMVAYVKKNGLNSRIHTNATMLNENLSNKLLSNGLNYISFSFDGFDKETYEKNRINANFEKTLTNILNFLKIKKSLKKNTFVVLQIINSNISISKNIKADFLKQFEKLPLNKVSIRTPHNWAGGISASGIERVKKPIPCTFPWYGLTIFYNGRTVPCPQDYKGMIYLGDASKEKLSDIWNGKAMHELRQKFSEKNYSSYSPCANCDRIWRKRILGVPLEYIGTFFREAKIRK